MSGSFITKEELEPTPSRIDGVSAAQESELRVYGCRLVQDAAVLLKVPQICAATAMVYLQRFYHVASLKEHDVRYTALGALFLACKAEENARAPRHVINVFHALLMPGAPLLEPGSGQYWEMKDAMFRAEMHILRELGFAVDVVHPHKYVLNYASVILRASPALSQLAWSFANDCLQTSVPVRWGSSPWVVAVACLYFAARTLSEGMPEDWYEVFDAPLPEILEIVGELVDLYSLSSCKWTPVAGAKTPFGLADVS